MGFKLVVVTARPPRERELSLAWVDRHFPGGWSPLTWDYAIPTHCRPGLFETVICTGQSQETTFADGHERITKLNKAEVSAQTGSTTTDSDSVLRSANKSMPRS